MADETRWMTYMEIAEALKIGADSARNLVRRKRWPRQSGNDGMARIAVPIEHLVEHAKPDAPGDGPAEVPSKPLFDLASAIAALERHIERLERELGAAVAERDTERERAAQIVALEAVLAIERQRCQEARDEAERWRQLALAPRGLWAWLRRGNAYAVRRALAGGVATAS